MSVNLMTKGANGLALMFDFEIISFFSSMLYNMWELTNDNLEFYLSAIKQYINGIKIERLSCEKSSLNRIFGNTDSDCQKSTSWVERH